MEPYLVMENEQMYLESGAWKNMSIDPDQNMYFLLIYRPGQTSWLTITAGQYPSVLLPNILDIMMRY